MLIPNCTDYHCFAFGSWMCEAVVSAADPEVSVEVLKVQLEDLKDTKVIVCYQESREVTLKALQEIGKLGSIKVIVLENACPNEGY